MPIVSMTVRDSSNGSPIRGAVIIFTAEASEGSWTGHGGASTTLFLAEAISDGEGRFSIPRQNVPAPYFLNTQYRVPTMLIFMPGYKNTLVQNYSQAPDRSYVTKWDHNHEPIEMIRDTTPETRAANLDHAMEFATEAYSHLKPCGWKNIPRALKALEHEFVSWTLTPESKQIRLFYGWEEGPVSKIIRERADSVSLSCPAANAYFKSDAVTSKPVPVAIPDLRGPR